MAAITAAAIGAGAAIYSANKASKDAKEQRNLAREGIEAADPYAPYRKDAADRLSALMKDPSKISETATYKARMQAAERQLAAQGYTGSGNAVIAAADAGASAYQQEFDNLALLSGAGALPGAGYGNALQANQAGNEQYLSAIAGVGNNLTNLGATIGDRYKTGGGGQKFNVNTTGNTSNLSNRPGPPAP